MCVVCCALVEVDRPNATLTVMCLSCVCARRSLTNSRPTAAAQNRSSRIGSSSCIGSSNAGSSCCRRRLHQLQQRHPSAVRNGQQAQHAQL